VPIGKDGRVIACHVGSFETGFLEGCKLVFRPRKKSSNPDYHGDMNASVFKKWFLQFLNKLDELNIQRAVTVMDNASCHSVIVDKAPASNSKKADIVAWLSGKNIPYDPNQTQADLLAGCH
jgi:hypothetical protein